LMDHPNIAKVLDAGATDTGRPFFVMELVRGVPITEYCDQNNRSPHQRLELFIPVCKAIQHAHQKGIIHRDIKPSNILVTLHDGVPVPKVIDFGIAKAIDQPLTEKTLFTRFEQFMGTPAYMSPEQAEMSGLDIDTRSDIYALGVLLYELLAGKPPFDPDALVKSGVEAMRKTIREVEPPRPSTRLSTLAAADLTVIAKKRGTEPAKLSALVRGDLDWIVMKCLEKDRTRRYETANGLAVEVQRYLDDEPVMARPPSAAYRFQKAFRRNKLAFTAGAMVTASLAIGLGVSTREFFKEKQARRRAVAAEQQQTRLRQQAETDEKMAQTEAVKSRQTAQFLKDMLNSVGPSVALGRDTQLLREVLDQTAERVGRELKDQPLVEAELRNTIGEVYLALGNVDKAEAMQREALALQRKTLGDENRDVATSLFSLAKALHVQGKYAEAESLHREALVIRRKLLGNENPEVATSLDNLSRTLRAEGKFAEAESLQREALAIRRKLFGNEHADVATSLHNLANILSDQDKLVEAESMHTEALAIRRKLFGNEHPDIASSLYDLARVLRLEDKLVGAEAMQREGVAIRRKLLGNNNLRTVDSLTELTHTLVAEKKFVEAESVAREALASWNRNAPDDWRMLDCRSLLGASLLGQGKYIEAEPVLLSGYQDLKRLENRIPAFEQKTLVSDAQRRLVQLYEATNRPDQAAEWKKKLVETTTP